MSRNPQILYDSVLPLGEAVPPVFPEENVLVSNSFSPFTYEYLWYRVHPGDRTDVIRWESGSGGVPADALGILLDGYYLGSSSLLSGQAAPLQGSVFLEGSDNGSSWAAIHTYTGLRSGANYFSFDLVAFPHYRITINITSPIDSSQGHLSIRTLIRNIMLGQRLEFERPIIRTHDPLPLNRTTEYQTNLSGNGQFLGRSISRRGVASSIDIPMMSREFARGPFQQFVEHAQRYPYYFSWNEALHPGDAGYVWTDEDIQTGYSGDGSLMSASWNMRGF